MTLIPTHAAPAVLTAFMASLVECVEALTVVLAVGSVRGWRAALGGSGAALIVLLALVAALGPALTHLPLHLLQIGVGTLLLLFGLRWLRKAILRAAGRMKRRDEAAAFVRETARLQAMPGGGGWDTPAFVASFQITMLEGIEVVFIVIAIGAGGTGLLRTAGAGALAALVTVAALGLIAHRPLSRVPENSLKFAVGVLLAAFGTFWVGEGLAVAWPGGDAAIPALVAGYLTVAVATTAWCRRRIGPA